MFNKCFLSHTEGFEGLFQLMNRTTDANGDEIALYIYNATCTVCPQCLGESFVLQTSQMDKPMLFVCKVVNFNIVGFMRKKTKERRLLGNS